MINATHIDLFIRIDLQIKNDSFPSQLLTLERYKIKLLNKFGERTRGK